MRSDRDARPAAVFAAYAKLNLGLWILGKRPDGYHEIETVFQAVDLADELTFEDAEPGTLDVTCDGGEAPSGPANLAYRAAALLGEAFPERARGARIRIVKEIPSGAGLGGGSSDAAATLLALNERWELGLDPPDLERLGARLGSDVPFFIRGGTQAGRGRGEILEPLRDLVGVFFLVVLPGFRVSTAWAYASARIGLTAAGSGFSMVKLGIQDGDFRHSAGGLRNDLEPVVTAEHPELSELRRLLEASGLLAASMTGSGSGYFGVASRLDQAEAVRAELSGRGWTAFLVRPCPVGARRLR